MALTLGQFAGHVLGLQLEASCMKAEVFQVRSRGRRGLLGAEEGRLHRWQVAKLSSTTALGRPAQVLSLRLWGGKGNQLIVGGVRQQ